MLAFDIRIAVIYTYNKRTAERLMMNDVEKSNAIKCILNKVSVFNTCL